MTESTQNLSDLIKNDRVLQHMQQGEPVWWWQEPCPSVEDVITSSKIARSLPQEAAARFKNFAPWFMKNYPESKVTGGILESPLQHEKHLTNNLNLLCGRELQGGLWFKRDDLLPVSGSVKARGGIHEVLEIAERIAKENGLIEGDPAQNALAYKKLGGNKAREVFSKHGIAVGSTGNLGLSIGLVAARFGFQTTVHMSQDAKGWKKDLLRSQGVRVVEHEGDFSQAVDAGREEAAGDPTVHFVDDENSLSLFSGYAVAAWRLKAQLQSLQVSVDTEHPLFVYLPCGVGGAPGGLTYGLKEVFGDAVQVILVEPTQTPAMTLGVRTGLHDGVSAHDLGLSGLTIADGLAVGRPSALVGRAIGGLFDGFVTLTDAQIMAQLGHLYASENIAVEPSAASGIGLPWLVESSEDFLAARDITPERLRAANHIVWFTGGSMVPTDEVQKNLSEAAEAGTQLGPAVFSTSKN